MKTSHLKESEVKKSNEKDEDDYFEKLEIKKKKESNVKSKEKVSSQNFQEQMKELRKMQLIALEESEKRQQRFLNT